MYYYKMNTCTYYVTLQDEEEAVENCDGWDDWCHGKALIKPADQVELTEAVRNKTLFLTRLAELLNTMKNYTLSCIGHCLFLLVSSLLYL